MTRFNPTLNNPFSSMLLFLAISASSQAQVTTPPVFAYSAALEYADLYEICNELSLKCDNSYMLWNSSNLVTIPGPSTALKTATEGWMGKLPDDMLIREISIPGTRLNGVRVKCQSRVIIVVDFIAVFLRRLA